MNKEIVQIFEATTKKFRDAVSAFSEEQLNQVPFENSWTAAQVADHVLRSQSRFPQLLGGNTAAADRDPNEKTAITEKIFLDFTVKLNAPEFIIPTTEHQKKDALLKRIDDAANRMTEAIRASDLTRVCVDFALPNMGTLTGLEWSWFQVYHTQRHTKQIENIYTSISKLESSTL